MKIRNVATDGMRYGAITRPESAALPGKGRLISTAKARPNPTERLVVPTVYTTSCQSATTNGDAIWPEENAAV